MHDIHCASQIEGPATMFHSDECGRFSGDLRTFEERP